MTAEIHTTISAMKIALGFAYDGAVRARILDGDARMFELEEVGRQIAKAHLLQIQIMRMMEGGPRLSVVSGPYSTDIRSKSQ